MPALGAPMQKTLLDYMLGGAAPSPPAGRFMGLSLGSPSSISYSEIGTGSGYSRQSMGFGPAFTTINNAGIATNASGATYGPFSSAAVISSIFISDSVSYNTGTPLLYGLLSAARSVSSGDMLVIASASFSAQLS